MCSCGCGLTLALAEIELRQSQPDVAPAAGSAATGPSPQCHVRGWEALKHMLRAAVSGGTRSSASSTAAATPA